jgi:PAS domain-containing protein
MENIPLMYQKYQPDRRDLENWRKIGMLSQIISDQDGEDRVSYERARIRELTAEIDLLRAELRREKALRRSEERYREIFENANDVIYTQDFDGRFIVFNKAVERLTGYSREELIGMHMSELIAPEYLSLCESMIRSQTEKWRLHQL